MEVSPPREQALDGVGARLLCMPWLGNIMDEDRVGMWEGYADLRRERKGDKYRKNEIESHR
jgi:hypothetical protein